MSDCKHDHELLTRLTDEIRARLTAAGEDPAGIFLAVNHEECMHVVLQVDQREYQKFCDNVIATLKAPSVIHRESSS